MQETDHLFVKQKPMRLVLQNSLIITLVFRASGIRGPNARNWSLVKFRVQPTALHFSMKANKEKD